METIRITVDVTVDIAQWAEEYDVAPTDVRVDLTEYVAQLIEQSYPGRNGVITKVATSR